jgi:Mrp family chromosome partitioning ATPase
MTLIDQAVIKAFQRREHSEPRESRPAHATRELFVHAPEALLRGVHHTPRPDHASAPAHQPSAAAVDPDSVATSDRREAESAATERFRPAWETDAFRTTETCRAIRTQLNAGIQHAAEEVLQSAANGQVVICITGLRRGEGRTTVATLLAYTFVALGRSVILVDADRSNPSLSSHLGVASDSGWNTANCQAQDVAECCVHSLADGFTMLPLDPAVAPSNRSLLNDMRQLLRLLASSYEVVIVDAGIAGPDIEAWPHSLINSYVVLRDARDSDDPAVEQFAARLASAGRSAVRLVENFANSVAVHN